MKQENKNVAHARINKKLYKKVKILSVKQNVDIQAKLEELIELGIKRSK